MKAHVLSLIALLPIIMILGVTAPMLCAQEDFIRGDCNVDGRVDVGDAIWIIQLSYLDGPVPTCQAACEADGDGLFNALVDGLSLFSYLFASGSPPPAPFPDCGPDNVTAISCDTYDCGATPPGPSDFFVFSLPAAVQGTGLIVEVPVGLEVLPNSIAVGWSYGVCHDTTALSLEEVDLGDSLAQVNDGDGPDLDYLLTHDGGWTSAVLVHFFAGDLLTGMSEVRVAQYTVLSPLGSTTPLEFCDTLGDPPVALAVSQGLFTTYTPTTVNGSVEVVAAFRRGDVNADGVVNVLADAIYLLAFGFQGGPAPLCLDSVDVDDNGSLNSLVDGLALLSYGFLGGPPPAAPGIVCGADPTPDGLDCLQYFGCP